MTRKQDIQHEIIMYLDNYTSSSILDIMFINNSNQRKDYYIGYNEISLMNLMFVFLNKYNGNNIVADFYKKFTREEKNYTIDFYIYFIYTYYQLHKDKNDFSFSREFVTNLHDLYYLNEVELEFNPDKFTMHYDTAETEDLKTNEPVHKDLIKYIENNLPSDLQNDLEKSIGIYILLCQALQYDPIYTITNDVCDTIPYYEITPKNNKTTCIQFSLIYHKLLELYGIESNLSGNCNHHMYVNLNFGTMMITADSTRYGCYNNELELSDLTNTKFNFCIQGFYINEKNYFDSNYIKYNNEVLQKTISEVYRKLNLSLENRNKIKNLINRYLQSEELKDGIVNKEIIDQRIAMINETFSFKGNNVESTQFLNWIIELAFADIYETRGEVISLYRVNNNQIELSKLVVLYEEGEIPHYYFLSNGKLINHNIDTVIDILLSNDWCFKFKTDIDALNIDDDTLIKKLSR